MIFPNEDHWSSIVSWLHHSSGQALAPKFLASTKQMLVINSFRSRAENWKCPQAEKNDMDNYTFRWLRLSLFKVKDRFIDFCFSCSCNSILIYQLIANLVVEILDWQSLVPNSKFSTEISRSVPLLATKFKLHLYWWAFESPIS